MAKANELGATVVANKLHWQYEKIANGFILHTAKGSYKLPVPALTGNHQFDNAATAVVACEQLSGVGIKLSPSNLTHWE